MSQYYRDKKSNETLVSWKAITVDGMKKPLNVEAFAVIDATTCRMLKIDIVCLTFTDDGSHPSYELRPVLAAINEVSGGYWYEEAF